MGISFNSFQGHLNDSIGLPFLSHGTDNARLQCIFFSLPCYFSTVQHPHKPSVPVFYKCLLIVQRISTNVQTCVYVNVVGYFMYE